MGIPSYLVFKKLGKLYFVSGDAASSKARTDVVVKSFSWQNRVNRIAMKTSLG